MHTAWHKDIQRGNLKDAREGNTEGSSNKFYFHALSENKPDLRVLYPDKPSFKSKMKQDSLSQQNLSQVPPERTHKGCSNINRFE